MTVLKNIVCFMWLQVFLFWFGVFCGLLFFPGRCFADISHVICLIWESFLVPSLECGISQLSSSMTSCGLF